MNRFLEHGALAKHCTENDYVLLAYQQTCVKFHLPQTIFRALNQGRLVKYCLILTANNKLTDFQDIGMNVMLL
jgi:hypothetical protein